MKPARGRVLVRPIQTEETKSGGVIVLTEKTRRDIAQYQMEIVAVGDAEICEDVEDCDRLHEWYDMWVDGEQLPVAHYFHPIDPRITEGAWVMVQPRSLFDAGHPTERLYFVSAGDILGIFTEC